MMKLSPYLQARNAHEFRANSQRALADTMRAPGSVTGGMDMPCDGDTMRNAVAGVLRKGLLEAREKCKLGIFGMLMLFSPVFLAERCEAVELVAHCTLKGVFIPDGAFTDSAGVTVELITQVPPSRENVTVQGRVSLQMNAELSAGTWQASGVLQGVAGVPEGQARLAGVPVEVDATFDIPFEAPLGDSVLRFKFSVNGRRVHQYFSDQHLVPGALPLDQSDFGLIVHRISSASADAPLDIRYTPNLTFIRAQASNSTQIPRCSERIDQETTCGVFIQGRADASAAFLGGTRLHLMAFTYHDFTIFQFSNAELTAAGRGILAVQGFRSNLTVTEIPPMVPVSELGLNVVGASVFLTWDGTADAVLQVEASNDLADWVELGETVQSRIGSNSVLFQKNKTQFSYFRLKSTP